MDVHPTSQFTLPGYPTRPLFTIPGPDDVWVRGEDIEEEVEGYEEQSTRLIRRRSSFRVKVDISHQK